MVKVAHFGKTCSELFSPTSETSKKFYGPEVGLVDCCNSLNQALSPENRLLLFNSCVSFQEVVIWVGLPKKAYGGSNHVFKKRNFYRNKRKTNINNWIRL